MGSRLFVGNLSFKATDEDLREVFSDFGVVTDVRIMTDRETGRSRGFAFVTFETEMQSRMAMSGMNSQLLLGRSLVVNEAVDKTKKVVADYPTVVYQSIGHSRPPDREGGYDGGYNSGKPQGRVRKEKKNRRIDYDDD